MVLVDEESSLFNSSEEDKSLEEIKEEMCDDEEVPTIKKRKRSIFEPGVQLERLKTREQKKKE
jgi:hypothetical protein